MYIKADDVCVTFPVFDAHQRSFKKTFFKAAAGGGLSSFRKGFAEIEALWATRPRAKRGRSCAKGPRRHQKEEQIQEIGRAHV